MIDASDSEGQSAGISLAATIRRLRDRANYSLVNHEKGRARTALDDPVEAAADSGTDLDARFAARDFVRNGALLFEDIRELVLVDTSRIAAATPAGVWGSSMPVIW